MSNALMVDETLSLAFSPCPNDTFIFSAIASGKVTIPGVNFDIKLHDIDELNRAALETRYDIIKVSCYTWLQIMDQYNLLDTGAAVGYGNGPLLLASQPHALTELKACSIGFPGKLTTAYLLFQLLGIETGEHLFFPYNEIIPKLSTGEIDCGVIIHESRFTYEKSALHFICDLGNEWEKATKLPVPLGCFVIRKGLDGEFARKFEMLMCRSISESGTVDPITDKYIIDNAQEMDPGILRSHIELYVNSFTHSLGVTGLLAINTLAERAKACGLCP